MEGCERTKPSSTWPSPTGEEGERPHAQVVIFDKRSKIIAQCKSVLDRMSAVLSFGAGLQTQASTQMEADSNFWGSSSSFLSTVRN